MFRRVDQSNILIKLLQRLSSMLARRRGLPILVGIILVLLAFIIQLINLQVESPVIELIQVVLHNVGILAALLGILLAEPLGQ